jgi:NaMN:DMB phosphoribosyltransferase
MQPVAIAGDLAIPLQAAGPETHHAGGSTMLTEDVPNRLNSLTKPIGSLGFLEEIAAKMAMSPEQARQSIDMRVGAGTGAGLSFNIIEPVVKIMRDMAAFENASITAGSER